MITKHKFLATQSSSEVSALLNRPEKAKCLLVLGHGAGANMQHPFMEKLAGFLADFGVATFRYNFPYMEQGKRFPSPQPILLKTVRSAVAEAHKLLPDLPLFAGGKSMGGRMTSLAASREPLPNVKAIVFFGFPLHAPGKDGRERAKHLFNVSLSMLFLQGTRDKLANLTYLEPVCDELKEKATLKIFDDADHSFNVPKRIGKTSETVLKELASSASQWMLKIQAE